MYSRRTLTGTGHDQDLGIVDDFRASGVDKGLDAELGTAGFTDEV